MTVFSRSITLAGVIIYNRIDGSNENTRDIEVRAGTNIAIPSDSGLITTNLLCGTFTGPASAAGNFIISCAVPLPCDAVSLQMVQSVHGTILALNEVEFLQLGKFNRKMS
jgi:hypothetical protein